MLAHDEYPQASATSMRESRLLEHVTRPTELPGHVVLPPGDDLAAVEVPSGRVLIGVDQVIDGRHVDIARQPLSAVGWKAVARCVSDVAAMAGRPLASLAAVALPRGFGEDRATELFEAVRAAAARLEAPLVGGDIAIHGTDADRLVLSITVLGTPGPAGLVRRSGARPGDVLCVTGRLGGSLEADGGGRHLTFEPRIAAALELAEVLGGRLHALVDLSDGLGRDAGRVARASGVAFELEADRLPRHEGVGWRGAVGDGEDYELLAAVSGEPPAVVAGVPVTVIGRVVAAEPPSRPAGAVRLARPAGEGGGVIDVSTAGWDHADDAESPEDGGESGTASRAKEVDPGPGPGAGSGGGA